MIRTAAGTRVVGAALLLATAGIHLYLLRHGYGGLGEVSRGFQADAVGGAVLAVAVVTARSRLLLWAAAAGAALEAGTLLGLLLAVTRGLFGFVESSGAPLFWPSVVVEAVGAGVLAAVALTGRTRSGRGDDLPTPATACDHLVVGHGRGTG